MQLRQQLALAARGNHEWAVTFHHYHRRIQIKFGQLRLRSLSQTCKRGKGFPPFQFGFRFAHESWPDPRNVIVLARRFFSSPLIFLQRA